MRCLLTGLAVLIAVVALAAAVGATLPRSHVATRAARIPASPDRVWATLAEVAAYPRWRPDVRAVELLPPHEGRTAWREESRHGRIAYAMSDERAPATLTTTITDRGLPFGGRWQFLLRPEGDGTRVVVTEHGEVYNPVFRLVSRFVFGHTATIDAYLRALGRHYGAEVTPETPRVATVDAGGASAPEVSRGS